MKFLREYPLLVTILLALVAWGVGAGVEWIETHLLKSPPADHSMILIKGFFGMMVIGAILGAFGLVP